MSKSFWLSLISGVIISNAFATTTYRVDRDSIIITGEDKIPHRCPIFEKIEISDLSFDKSAVIVSSRGYVPSRDLNMCDGQNRIHVSQIPDHVGALSDINLKHGIYVALDLSSVSPMSWLATVSRVGSRSNLVTLPGAYVANRKRLTLRKQAFTGTGDERMAIISRDGNYVSPTGAMSCDQFAYPGVWEIHKNRRVITDDVSCAQLFESK